MHTDSLEVKTLEEKEMYLELFKKFKNTTINNKICNHRYYCSHLKLLFFFLYQLTIIEKLF